MPNFEKRRKLLRDRRWVGHALRRQDGKQSVIAGVLGDNVNGFRVALRAGVSQDIDRIAMAPMHREKCVKSIHGLRREPGQFAAILNQLIGREDSRAARIGDNGKAPARRARLHSENFSHIEQIRNAIDAQNAAAAEGGVEYVVASGKNSRVGCRGVGSLAGASGLDHDDGLVESHFARRGEECAGITDGLHVDDDAARVWVITEVIDEIRPSHVQHGTNREKCAEAGLFLEAPIENGCAERAALTDESDGSLPCHRTCERGIQAGNWAHDTQAVWPDDAHLPAANFFKDAVFQFNPVGPGLLETRRDDHRAFDAAAGAFRDDVWNRRCWRDDDRKVDRFRYLGDTRVGLYA